MFITYYNAKQAMPTNYANFSSIPKLHAMDHYVQSIHLLGSVNGYNTEGPECLHINFAKLGYCTSNHKNYFSQMTTWLDCQEASICFDTYLHWLQPLGLIQSKAANKDHESSDDKDESAKQQDKELKETEDEEEGVAQAETTRIQFKVAKKPPYLLLSAGTVTKSHGAHNFSWHLEAFLTERARSATQPVPLSALAEIEKISTETEVPVYKQLKLQLSTMVQVSTTESLE